MELFWKKTPTQPKNKTKQNKKKKQPQKQPPPKKKQKTKTNQPTTTTTTNKKILQDRQLPISLKKQVTDQCVLPKAAKHMVSWQRTAQKAVDRKMFDLKLHEKYHAQRSGKEQR